MQKIVFILILAFVIPGCGEPGKNTSGQQDSSVVKPADSSLHTKSSWADSLVLYYIAHTDNELVKMARQDTIPEEWLLDRIENTDTAKYLIFQIGHDMTDEGNSNPRFVTDAWICIDSLTRKIYEYDIPGDSLIYWKKNL